MTGSIKRVLRLTSVRPLVPVMMVVMVMRIPSPSDPNRRSNGYGGVLPVPAPSSPVVAASPRADGLLDQQHRDQRSARGRVLYASGRAPQVNPASRVEPKPQCERRVVQGRATSPAPNS